MAKLSPVTLPASAEVRLRRLAPGATYQPDLHRLLMPDGPCPATGGFAPVLVALLRRAGPAGRPERRLVVAGAATGAAGAPAGRSR